MQENADGDISGEQSLGGGLLTARVESGFSCGRKADQDGCGFRRPHITVAVLLQHNN